jgi:hypothetical protein
MTDEGMDSGPGSGPGRNDGKGGLLIITTKNTKHTNYENIGFQLKACWNDGRWGVDSG